MALGSVKNTGWKLKPSQLLWKLSDSTRQAREARLLTPDAALGRRGEDMAHRYLQGTGYAVVGRNYKPGVDSEIDIIARKDNFVVFVEVKSRTSIAYGAPERAIDIEKQKHIIRAARAYAARAGIEWTQVRFDVISVVFTKPPSILHQQDAFFPSRTN
jgi:putative endonuclease